MGKLEDKVEKQQLDWLNRLVDLMDERSLSILEIENETSCIKLARGSGGVISAPASVMPSMAVADSGSAGVGDVGVGGDDIWQSHAGAIKSPIVGMVYLSSQPDVPPFFNIGDSVKEGDTVLIVEAMKVMNPIRAPRSGILKHLAVSNEEAVEYGQLLAVIE